MKVAVSQLGSVLFNTPATLERIERSCREAAHAGVQLLVFPEALLGGYPRGLTFGASLGERTPAGRDLYLRYFRAAIDCPGPETERLATLARDHSLHIVIGVVERGGNTLFCSSLLFTPEQGLVSTRRKLMPTGSERLIWGQGDGAGLGVAHTSLGRIGTAICWENYMPLYRQFLYGQGVELWCAPTVDSREIWQATMRHIAYEGRCFVLSACQHLTPEDWPEDLREQAGTIAGRSLIVAPSGEILAGPLAGSGLLFAEIDLDEIPRGKFDLDVAGHYNRPDLFTLTLHRQD